MNTVVKKLCLVAVALPLSSVGAFAQTPPTTPQPSVGPPAAVVVPSDIPWHTFELIERRYKIEAVRFKALDETGIDWPGSDEVMVETTDAKGFTVTNEIGDIDSGDTHTFDPAKSCIVSVRPGVVVLGKTSVCDDAGEPAPLWFQVDFWEKDLSWYGVACKAFTPAAGRHAGPHCGNDGFGDDFIGRRRIELSIQELETLLPNVGDEHIKTESLFGCRNLEQICTTGFFDPDYTFTFRVTRLPDVRIGVRSVLDEAMRKISSVSELETIVAGLRSLPTPTPHDFESAAASLPVDR